MFKDNSPADQAAVRMATRRGWSNRAATTMISLGGAGVIAIVVAIFIFIGFETLPLWVSPDVVTLGRSSMASDDIIAVGENEYQTVGYSISSKGAVNFFEPKTGSLLGETALPIRSTKLISTDPLQRSFLQVDSSSQATIFSVNASYGTFSDSLLQGRISTIVTFPVPGPIRIADFRMEGPDSYGAVFSDTEDNTSLFIVTSSTSLFGGSTVTFEESRLSSTYEGELSSLAIDQYLDKVVIGTTAGKMYYWDVRNPEEPRLSQEIEVGQSAISAFEFLLGGQTLIVGEESGRVSSWTWVLDTSAISGLRVVLLNEFEGHSGSVLSIAPSPRNKSFVTSSASGEVFLHYQTTGKTLVKRSISSQAVPLVTFSPKSNGSLALLRDGTVVADSIYNPHPEISLGVLFGKVQYEGYRNSSYTWQSTGGTDDFESKFSLMPLLVGTIKGALYALIFALPVAILAALYTALFAHAKIKNLVKPTVEIMAALPSVVIGFIAALWLAPFLEQMFVDVALMVLMFPLAIILAAILWKILPRTFTDKLLAGSEIFFIVPALLVVFGFSLFVGPPVEQMLFQGTFRQWLFETMQITYDQRNSIVVGFAMGFAVIPIIFTISEDALSSVPQHLTAGSLALGATRWQTATRVVLPTASPGIFSAAMIGFGRAVGETMIVLMATGNTPVLDLSAFVGMRTLSANIAVEIPEAPYLGTLYRVLFFSGLLLFAFTFVINTVAEVVRQRLRKRYSTI